MEKFDSIVAGSGIWGCTVARRLAEAGRNVLVLEKRSAIGGNCRCEIDSETGIEIHTYGSHIFHTHNRQVWDFVRRFTDFNGYQHKVLANYQGKVYHLPLGLTLINKFFGVELKPGDEPYYPINCLESLALVARYQNEAKSVPNLILGGRLGQYRYYDMDQAMASALEMKV